MSKADLPVLAFLHQAAWEDWLAGQPLDSAGAWLKFAKKGSGAATLSKQDAIDSAVCHGWIDGQLGSFDEAYFLIRFTPRKAKSIWSENNRTRALALIDEGRMRPAGIAEVEKARADGRWDGAYASQGKMAMPEDLQAALDADLQAARFFAALNGANRYAILHRLHNTRKPELRARKLEGFVDMLRRGETIHPVKKGG